MAKAPDYSSLVADAEKAVQSVKDPELKRIAFQKVLDDLLGGGGGELQTADLRRVKAKQRAKLPPCSKGRCEWPARVHSRDARRRLFQEAEDDHRRKG